MDPTGKPGYGFNPHAPSAAIPGQYHSPAAGIHEVWRQWKCSVYAHYEKPTQKERTMWLTLTATVTGGAGMLALASARALLEHGLSGIALLDLPTAKQKDNRLSTPLGTTFQLQRLWWRRAMSRMQRQCSRPYRRSGRSWANLISSVVLLAW